MNAIRVVVSNSPTKVPAMSIALFGGMAPPKKGTLGTNRRYCLGFFLNYYLRDDKIDVSFDADVTNAPFLSNSDYFRETEKLLDVLMEILKRKAPKKQAKL